MATAGVIFFDGGCGLCTTAARRWEKWLSCYGFESIPLQDPRATELLRGLADPIDRTEMLLLTPAGRLLGGVDAIGHVARTIRWAFPIHLMLQVPIVHRLAEILYRSLAKHRRRLSTACGLRPLRMD